MKHLLLTLVMVAVAMMLLGARPTMGASPTLKIYFKKPASWSTASIYYWNSQPGNQSNLWPGETMQATVDGWMSFELAGQSSTHLIFSDRGQNQTADLEIAQSSAWYQDGDWWSFNPDRFQYFVYPNGGTKSLILSFDDGNLQDARLIGLFNQYGLKGTFHLNSELAIQHAPNHIFAEDIAATYAGHEVAGHSATHPDLTNEDDATLKSEIFDDRTNLRLFSHQDVQGFAYPFGYYTDHIVDLLSQWGFLYARVVPTTQDYRLPNDLLLWQASGYQTDAPWLGHRYESEASTNLSLLMIWGHSWDLDTNNQPNNNWISFEGFLKEVSADPAIWSTTMSPMANYLLAVEAAQITPIDSTHAQIANLSEQSLWIKVEGGFGELPPHRSAISVHSR